MSSTRRTFRGSGTVLEPEPEPEPEQFGEFFETWLKEQDQDLTELTSAAKATHPESTQSSTESTQFLHDLVARVMSHYEKYYRVKSESVKKDVLHMFTPAWRSHLEDAFLWIGGWRPSMAFHLLYSISGIQLEAGLSELLRGLSKGDLGDLTPSQLNRVDELHRQTLGEEKQLTETLAAHQETVADSSMVELSHLATELTRDPDSARVGVDSVSDRVGVDSVSDRVGVDSVSDRVGVDSVSGRVDSALARKEDKLEEILQRADNLRLKTLKDVVDILSPIQAVYFLSSAAELHLRVHEWGKEKDVQTNGFTGPGPTRRY